jgi:hypothetical protein
MGQVRLVDHYTYSTDNDVVVMLPLQTKSEANQRGNWRTKEKRRKEQVNVASLGIRSGTLHHRGRRVSRVEMTRIGPRKLDTDNLHGALKYVRDGIALGLGINDDTDIWFPLQEKHPCLYGVRVRVCFEAMPSNTESISGIDRSEASLAESSGSPSSAPSATGAL